MIHYYLLYPPYHSVTTFSIRNFFII